MSLFGCFLYILGRSTDRLLRQDRLSRRPPGAIDEATFLALCTRCGACIQACPTGFLKQNKARSFLEIDCPEVFHSATAWCEHDCTACSQACPTGAIRKFSVRDKKDLKLGRAEFEFERCRLYEDVECSICARECPHEAISYEWSEEEYRRIVVVDDERCTGCGRCAVACPVTREGDAGFPLKILPR